MKRLFHEAKFTRRPLLPKRIAVEAFPFNTAIGFRGKIATFDEPFSPSPGLARDVQFLESLKLGNIAGGACDFPVYPFLAQLSTRRKSLTAADVVVGLRAKNFQSDHIKRLDVRRVKYPGYKPGTLNDEIHNDFPKQYIFATEDEEETPIKAAAGAHGQLQEYVLDGQVWYVLLHIDPHDHFNGVRMSEYVFLFAVGRSPHGPRLVGAVTNQVCHNLCD